MCVKLSSRLKLLDVGPRNGLQSEKAPVPADGKVCLLHRLQAAGRKDIEATRFVSPKRVPPVANSVMVMAGDTRRLGVATRC